MKLIDILSKTLPPAAGKKRNQNLSISDWMKTFKDFLVDKCGWIYIQSSNLSKHLKNEVDFIDEEYDWNYGQDYFFLRCPSNSNVIAFIDHGGLKLFESEKNINVDDDDFAFCVMDYDRLQAMEIDAQNGLLISGGILALKVT